MKLIPYGLIAVIGFSAFALIAQQQLKPVLVQGGSMDLKAQIQHERAEIIRLIGQAKADSPAQCRVLALGHKACGGPEAYAAYSVAQTDEALLLQHAQRYKELQQMWQKSEGMYSDCAIVPEPQVSWVGGYCVIGVKASNL